MRQRILITALGGEGGGVLAGWITDAAVSSGLAAQRTSIPGVAQRTGATTYYIEIIDDAGGRRPVMALNPCPGELEVVVASELMEAARMVQAGFVTPDRTTILSSTHRVFSIQERIAMGDGRADEKQMHDLIRQFSRKHTILDFAAIGARVGSHVNSVLLGAMSNELFVPAEALREAIRRDGRAVDANLRGFEAGLRAVKDGSFSPAVTGAQRPLRAAPPKGLEQCIAGLAPEIQPVVCEGLHRLVDFQDAVHAQKFAEHIRRFAGLAGADGEFLSELARHLAVRMSSEDTIRVAQLKLRDHRFDRLALEAKARDGDMIEVIEYLKPGPNELISIFPPSIARPLLRMIQERGWQKAAIPLKIRSTGVVGFIALRVLLAFKPMRHRSLRAADESAWISEWLDLVERALRVDPAAAAEIIRTAALVRGYGETWTRGHANWRCIVAEIVIPMLSGELPMQHFADAILQTRVAAQVDPEGRRLRSVVESIRALTDRLEHFRSE